MSTTIDTLVEEYKSQKGVANLFGVLLYTDEHPNIKKVLRDDDYWLSFHKLTGDRFCVFSVKPKKGVYVEPRARTGASFGVMGMMVRIWDEPDDNLELLELFELEDTKKLPMLLLFTQLGEQYLKIELPLDDTTQDTAYSSIREQLEFSCNALKQIKDEYLKNWVYGFNG